MELNHLAFNTEQGHDYEDLGKYSATIPPVPSVSDQGVTKCDDYDDTVKYRPDSKTITARGGDYDVVECPAYVPMEPQGQRSVSPLESNIYTDIKSE